ncbi:DUF4332 domain-containing protein [Methylobacterium nodulans]|uniref:Molybdenum cofactor biosynthesis protein n=1 Tax=Methylobacterium nodulans (strain LMG 21967 / CNCM I-2342 / ORS 2060) TaxID=460265 RepID=B8IBL2_METNO|nr:DUF4332 domain-containing protein [Methylobacterium nodulans]ACL59266.1 molybdenum cofactor biosynthesis protein [Methylobacterium nodulans ORS 2060]
MAYLIESVGCIGPFLADRLREAGIATTEALLTRAGDPDGRRQLAQATGIDAALLLRWVGRCDLFRIHGLARPMTELLEAAGICTVADLARQNADSLVDTLTALNTEGGFCAVTPTRRRVAEWIARAGALPPALA